MPTTLQGILVLLLFIIPGYLAVVVKELATPNRRPPNLDRTAQFVFFSTVIHLTLFPIAVWLAVTLFGFDPTDVDKDWLPRRLLGPAFFQTAVIVNAYFVSAILLGCFFGLVARRFPGQTPTWSRVFPAERVIPWPRWLRWIPWQRKVKVGFYVGIRMNNGDQYSGTLDKIPVNSEVLERQDKHFSLRDVTYLPSPSDRSPSPMPIKLPPNQIVLLNTQNVEIIVRTAQAQTKF